MDLDLGYFTLASSETVHFLLIILILFYSFILLGVVLVEEFTWLVSV